MANIKTILSILILTQKVLKPKRHRHVPSDVLLELRTCRPAADLAPQHVSSGEGPHAKQGRVVM